MDFQANKHLMKDIFPLNGFKNEGHNFLGYEQRDHYRTFLGYTWLYWLLTGTWCASCPPHPTWGSEEEVYIILGRHICFVTNRKNLKQAQQICDIHYSYQNERNWNKNVQNVHDGSLHSFSFTLAAACLCWGYRKERNFWLCLGEQVVCCCL